jgi:hypothetical protein
MKLGPVKLNLGIKINWSHVISFGLVVVGIFGDDIQKGIAAGTPLAQIFSWQYFAAAGVVGAVWLAFQQTILSDYQGPGSKWLGGPGKPKPDGRGLIGEKTPPVAQYDSYVRIAVARRSLFPGAVFAGVLIGLIFSGCQQFSAMFPQLDKIEQIIVQDLQAGKSAEQIEIDVGQLLAGQAGVDVVVVINDVITVLIDSGLIPKGIIPQAKQLQAAERLKLAARAQGGK